MKGEIVSGRIDREYVECQKEFEALKQSTLLLDMQSDRVYLVTDENSLVVVAGDSAEGTEFNDGFLYDSSVADLLRAGRLYKAPVGLVVQLTQEEC